jgi:hypothetical protein
MMKSVYLIIFLSIFSLAGNLCAQVEHNYPYKSGYTNCDSLQTLSPDFTKAQHAIEISTWRFKQSLKLNRLYGIHRAQFYSCDGQTGFLIVFSANKNCIYKIVPISVWNEFLKASDPEKYLEEVINKKYPSQCDQ